MPDWTHAPVHRLTERGVYMVTAGTYLKTPFFLPNDRRAMLHDLLLDLAIKHGWRLQAWAVLSNHYHFVGIVDSSPASLRTLVRQLHSLTAREVNALDRTPGRRVWFQFWDTHLTFQRSYQARLNYVHRNPSSTDWRRERPITPMVRLPGLREPRIQPFRGLSIALQ